MSTPLILFVLIPLMGLAFVLLVGRYRRTSAGAVEAPAPGSPDSPLFGEPTSDQDKS